MRSSSEVPAGKRSDSPIFESSLLASHTFVAGSAISDSGTSNCSATEGMICISPQAPRLDVMSGVKRDSW